MFLSVGLFLDNFLTFFDVLAGEYSFLDIVFCLLCLEFEVVFWENDFLKEHIQDETCQNREQYHPFGVAKILYIKYIQIKECWVVERNHRLC